MTVSSKVCTFSLSITGFMVKLWKPRKMFPSSETSIVPPVLIAPNSLGMAISRSFLPSKEYSAISEQALRLYTARMPSSVKPTLSSDASVSASATAKSSTSAPSRSTSLAAMDST